MSLFRLLLHLSALLSSVSLTSSTVTPYDTFPPEFRDRWYSPVLADTVFLDHSDFFGLGRPERVSLIDDGNKVLSFGVVDEAGRCQACVRLELMHKNVIGFERKDCFQDCDARADDAVHRPSVYSLLYRHSEHRSVADCPEVLRHHLESDRINVTYHEFAAGHFVGPCGDQNSAALCNNHLVLELNRCSEFHQLSHRTLQQSIRCVGYFQPRRSDASLMLVAQVDEVEMWSDGRARQLEDEYRCYPMQAMADGSIKLGQVNGETCPSFARSVRQIHLKKSPMDEASASGGLPTWFLSTPEWTVLPRAESFELPRGALRVDAYNALSAGANRYRLVHVSRSDDRRFEAVVARRGGDDCGMARHFCFTMERAKPEEGPIVYLRDFRETVSGRAGCVDDGPLEAALVASNRRGRSGFKSPDAERRIGDLDSTPRPSGIAAPAMPPPTELRQGSLEGAMSALRAAENEAVARLKAMGKEYARKVEWTFQEMISKVEEGMS